MLATLPAGSRPSRPRRIRAGLTVSALALLAGCGSADRPLLPNLAGRTLDDARTAATAAGFTALTSRDLLRARAQLVASNWRVCTQTPAAGPVDGDVTVELGVVKTDERCPGDDTGLPELVGETLPIAEDAAREAGFPRFTSHDATGERLRLDEQDWTVCTQTPAAGTTDREVTVDVGVVKSAEPCPGETRAATSSAPTTTASPRPAPKPAPKPQPNPQRGEDRDDGDDSGSGTDRRTSEPDPDPPSKPRSGQSGHPCLPGERDGDNDGFCGEGR